MQLDLNAMALDPAEFRRHVLIDAGGVAVPLAEVAPDWQEADFRAMDPAMKSVAGLHVEPAPEYRRAWLERTRGGSKTQDQALNSIWLLTFGRRPLRGVAVAADQGQAGILREAIIRLVTLNPWLEKKLEILRSEIRNRRTGSSLGIMATDETSSWGWLIDFAVMDEVSMWPDERMFVSVVSALGKKTNTLGLAIMNAGWRTSWAYKIRESIIDDPRWYFSAQERPAEWIGKEEIEEQRRLLPDASFKRLCMNIWSSNQGDGFTDQQIQRLVVHQSPLYFPEPKKHYAIGVDAGVEKHHSSVVTVEIDQERQRVRVANVEDFPPPVRLADVKAGILRARDRFGANHLFYDPSQMIAIAQDLEQAGMRCEKIHPSGAGIQSRMAMSLAEAVREQTLELYPDALLLEDLQGAQIVERPTGFRLEFAENQNGHSDRLAALVQVLPDALEAARLPIVEWEPMPARFTLPDYLDASKVE